MRKVIQKAEIKDITVYICDECGSKCTHPSGVRTCFICDRELCRTCCVPFNEKDLEYNTIPDDRDYSYYYICRDCWNAGVDTYIKSISDIRLGAECREAEIIESWRSERKRYVNDNPKSDTST